MENQNLAQGVKKLRKRKALSQEDLAKRAGLSLRTVQRVENGETIPTAETLKRLAAVLDVAPNELIEFVSEKEVPKIVLKTKYEYVHFFDSKLVFSKTSEINLVEDYGKSVGYAHKTLMVFFVAIPVFSIMTFVFYNLQKMDLVFYSGSICFFFLIMAFNVMLFTSGTPVIEISSIRKIKIKNIFLKTAAVEISFIESGRIKGRSLILEKDQVDNMMNSLLAEKLIAKDDIKINEIGSKINAVLPMITPAIFTFFFIYTDNLKLQQYFFGTFMTLLSLFVIVKMLKNSLFLRPTKTAKVFRENDKKWAAKLSKE